MNTLTNTTIFDILFKRPLHKIGDLAMALRAIELTRLANPSLHIALQCHTPLLIGDHPALDAVLGWDETEPKAELVIDLVNVFQKHNEPKHKTFCDLVSERLSSMGYNSIEWDGVPQSLWVSLFDRQWARSVVNNYTSHGKRAIGVFWRSEQAIRTWGGIKGLIQILSQSGKFVVFCFDASETLSSNENIVNIVGFALDKVIALVSYMSMVITPDTGGMHIAGGLGVDIFGIFGATDAEIIAGMYPGLFHFKPQCKYSPCWFDRRCVKKRCVGDIQPERIITFLEQYLPPKKKLPELWGLPDKEPTPSQETYLVIRFRGIGDIGLSWFSLEQLKRNNPLVHITYLTNPSSAAMFCGQKALVDKVLVMDYKHHAHEGEVALPPNIDASSYNKTINMANAVDFGDVAHRESRAKNFAGLMDVTLGTSPFVRSLAISEAERAWAKDRINYTEYDRIIVCQLDSMGRSRFWPEHHWLQFSELMYNYYGEVVKLVFLSVKERHKKLKVPPNVFNLSCETSVRQFIAMVGISDILICSDTSGLHIGGRIPTTKVISLFGSTGVTDDNQWAHTNYYNNIYPIQSDMDCSPCWDWQFGNCSMKKHAPVCMWKIKPKEVLHEVIRLLQGIPIDLTIKSSIPCPFCGTILKYINGHTLACFSCGYRKGHFDHIHFMTENIAVGNATAPQDEELLQLTQVGAIITVACDFGYTKKPSLPCCRFNLHDSTNNNIELFLRAVEQLRACVKQYNRTLVHCMGGGRRSVAVAAWYLSDGKRDEFWKIIQEFKKVRSVVKLDGGIHDFLDEYLR